jgi:2Fe-2S ferredoxin
MPTTTAIIHRIRIGVFAVMPKITIIEADGKTEHVLDATVGHSLMETAKNGDVPGIAADCGGCCICGTCHVYIDPAWRDRIGPPGDIETATMEFSEDVRSDSRLSCQIKITDDLDGLIVRVAES